MAGEGRRPTLIARKRNLCKLILKGLNETIHKENRCASQLYYSYMTTEKFVVQIDWIWKP